MEFLLTLPWLVVLCWHDWRTRLLPNWLTLGGAAVFLFGRLVFGGPMALVDGFATACLAGLFLLIPFIYGWVGGGDVKMLFAAGALAGWFNLLDLLVFTAISGLGVTLALVLCGQVDLVRMKHWGRCLFDWRYDRKAGAANLPSIENEKVRAPYSFAIAIGLMAVLSAGK